MGVNLYKSRFGFCESQNEYLISKEECESNSRIWVINDFNFENIWNALLTLFVIATFDNWINILHIARNSDLPNKGPSFLNNSYSSYLYFFAFILISVLFLVNLFLGIMFVKFQMAERAGGKGSTHLNENQEKWVQMQSRILSIEPYKNHFSSAVGLKKKLISIMTSKQYSFIMSIIPLIVIILLMNENYNGLRKEIDQANKAKNSFFSFSYYFFN